MPRSLLSLLALFNISSFLWARDIDLEPLFIRKTLKEIYEKRKNLLNSLPELLDKIEGLDLRRRSVYGIQQDLSIRGGSFEDNKIFLDSVRLNLPQTGHFSLELPLTLEDIEGFEVFKGANKVIFVSKTPQERGRLIEFEFGEHALFKKLISLNFLLGDIKNRISFEHRISSGYKKDTDFDVYILSFNSLKETDFYCIEFLLGLLNKKFGADSFYSSVFTSEYESIEDRLFISKIKFKQIYHPQLILYFRRLLDEFLLKREDPEFYKNLHKNYLWGSIFKIQKQNLSLEFEWRKEKIDSTRLQKHTRLERRWAIELSSKVKNANFKIGVNCHYVNRYQFLKDLMLGFEYRISDSFLLFSNSHLTFRLPSFTELFYFSPANKGNSNLAEQKLLDLEAGFQGPFFQDAKLTLIFFFRRQKDTIDWVRDNPSDPWMAKNIGNIEFVGIESIFAARRFNIKYTFLNLNKESRYRFSKYLFRYLRHHFLFASRYKFLGLDFFLDMNLKKRRAQVCRVIVDLVISKKIKNGNVFLKIENVGNTSYEDIEGVELAGRWIKMGFRYRF